MKTIEDHLAWDIIIKIEKLNNSKLNKLDCIKLANYVQDEKVKSLESIKNLVGGIFNFNKLYLHQKINKEKSILERLKVLEFRYNQ